MVFLKRQNMKVKEHPSIKLSCFADLIELHDFRALSKEDIEKINFKFKFM